MAWAISWTPHTVLIAIARTVAAKALRVLPVAILVDSVATGINGTGVHIGVEVVTVVCSDEAVAVQVRTQQPAGTDAHAERRFADTRSTVLRRVAATTGRGIA
jgi:hypothetical protein